MPDGHADKGKEIGLDDTPDAYVARLVEVFREVRRILRDDGTLWLNIGDSYAGGDTGRNDAHRLPNGLAGGHGGGTANSQPQTRKSRRDRGPGLKPKDLIGVPWALAFALRSAGWYLRSEIVWHKPAPMPESVTDRPTKAHEQVFLLSKNATYYYDGEAIREDVKANSGQRMRAPRNGAHRLTEGYKIVTEKEYDEVKGANRRSVWTVNSGGGFPGAHFAVMPEKLVEPCVLAGTSEEGCCPACGAPWARVVERKPMQIDRSARGAALGEFGRTCTSGTMTAPPESRTVGWRPSCACPPAPAVPCVILDPFAGSGTVPAVALRLGRSAVGVDLNRDYLALAEARCREAAGAHALFHPTTITVES